MENLANLFTNGTFTVYQLMDTTKLAQLEENERKHSLLYNLYNLDEFRNASDTTHIPVHTPEEGLIAFIVAGIAISVMTLIGFIGNVMTVIVLTKNNLYTKSISHLLLGLTISDIVFTFSCVFTIATPNICKYFETDFTRFYSFMVVPFVSPLATTAYMSSSYFIVAITIERYFAVAYPIQAKVYCTPSRAAKASVLIATFSIITNIPKWFEYVYVGLASEEDGCSVIKYLAVTTEFARGDNFTYVYLPIATFLIVVIPVVVLIVFNILIYRIVKRANLNRRKSSRNSNSTSTSASSKSSSNGGGDIGREKSIISLAASTISVATGNSTTSSSTTDSENSLAWMLITIVAVYLSCNCFIFAEGIYYFVTDDRTGLITESIRNFLYVFNSSVNFIIYCAYGKAFRAMFKDLVKSWAKCWCTCLHACRCCCYGQNEMSPSGRTSSVHSNVTVDTIC